MTIVADLFATLGLRVNESQFAAGSRRLQDMATATGNQVGGIGRIAGGLVGRFAPLIGGLFAANELKKGVQETINWDKSMTDLSISSDGVVTNLAEVTDEILKVSDETGVAKEGLLGGAQAFITLTGDAKTARESLLTFGKVAKASGADMSDVTGTAAAMSQALGIGADDMEKAFSILIAGGKAGSVELKDLSKVLAQIAPLTSEFEGGKGLSGLASTGAALQLIARGTGGNANMAVTRLQALTTALTSKATQFEKDANVKIFEKDLATGLKQRRNLMDLVNEISKSDLAKDPSKLIKSLGSIEAYNAYVQLVQTNGEWKDMADSTMKANDVAEDYAKRQASRSERISSGLNRLKNFSFGVFNDITDHAFTMFDALQNGSFFKDWPTSWMGMLGTIDVSFTKAINSWTNKFDNFSEGVLGFLGGLGEDAADSVSGAIDYIDYELDQNRSDLREEGKIRGLSGPALDQFVGQGVQNHVYGNPEQARADVEWRRNYNQGKSPGGAMGDAFRVMRMYGQVNAPVSVVVNGANATADEIAEKVRIMTEEQWDMRMREADEAIEATGG